MTIHTYIEETDLLDDTRRVFVFHATWYNGVRTSHELCIRANRMRVILVVVAVVFGSFLLLYT